MKDPAKMSDREMRREIVSLRKLLAFAACPDTNCREGVIPHRVSETEWEAEQCQWCDERKALTGS